jgi:hypothetical protein
MVERTHELKTLPPYFEAVAHGDKNFEVRRNDRGFQTGDRVVLREYDPASYGYSGREIRARIAYILPGDGVGLQAGYCVLGLANVEQNTGVTRAVPSSNNSRENAFVFAWTAPSGDFPAYLNLTGDRLTVRAASDGCACGETVAIDLPHDVIIALADELALQILREHKERETVKS